MPRTPLDAGCVDQPPHRRILGDPANTPDSHRSRFSSARQSPPNTSMIARSSKILPESQIASGLRHNANAVDSARSMPLALISSISSNPSYR
jgi:hypothetical protein